MRASGGMAEA
uniref:Uncharacterized protein n=1 Tax=Arundo donax TaxID=35708 RepID=A0A0A8YQQ6_ARUDO